jgi:hypothetical protein
MYDNFNIRHLSSSRRLWQPLSCRLRRPCAWNVRVAGQNFRTLHFQAVTYKVPIIYRYCTQCTSYYIIINERPAWICTGTYSVFRMFGNSSFSISSYGNFLDCSVWCIIFKYCNKDYKCILFENMFRNSLFFVLRLRNINFWFLNVNNYFVSTYSNGNRKKEGKYCVAE